MIEKQQELKKHLLQAMSAKDNPLLLNTSNLKADGLQKQKTAPGVTPVSLRKPTLQFAGSATLDNGRLEKYSLVR